MGRSFSLGTLAVGLGATVVVRAVVKDLELLPDRYPEAALRREPSGKTSWVERADGTMIRAVVSHPEPQPGRSTVVLAHGFGQTIACWSVLWDQLVDAGHRVIAFDQRAHGQSTIGTDGIGIRAMAGDCAAVLEQLRVKDGVLVGLSMGALLAIAALQDERGVAERLRGFVCASGFAGRILEGSLQNRLQVPLFRSGVAQRIMATRSGRMLLGRSFFGDAPSPAGIRVMTDVLLAQSQPRLAEILAAYDGEDRYRRLGEISVPTAVVVGEKDRTTPRWHAEALARGIPDARLVVVPSAGHLLNWEAPEALTLAVANLGARPVAPAASTSAATPGAA